MTSVSWCLKFGGIHDVFADSLLMVSLPDPMEEHGYLNLPRRSGEEFNASHSSSNSAILELHLPTTWLTR